MAKPQRKLWELNNQYAEFWGQSGDPEPVGGFADEAPPPASFDQVASWFRDAIPARGRVPAAEEIARIARLVDAYREYAGRSPPPRDVQTRIALQFQKAHALQHAAAELAKTLAPVLDLLLRNPTPGNPAVTRLVDLWNALRLAEPYIGPPSKQGPQMRTWHFYAGGLEEPIRTALRSAGAPVSTPLVKVVCSALLAIDGMEHTPEAVETFLKRRRRHLKRVSKI